MGDDDRQLIIECREIIKDLIPRGSEPTGQLLDLINRLNERLTPYIYLCALHTEMRIREELGRPILIDSIPRLGTNKMCDDHDTPYPAVFAIKKEDIDAET